ncbi:MAG TPA: hypothetical protein VHB99_13425, partial [Pirellulales bacterium]|nr:hypothetical protein [Pirellulales bacterium]
MRYESAWPVAAAATPQLSIAQPLCVDLEGALVKTDLTAEAMLLLAKQRPWMLPLLLWRAIWGWANFKRRIFQLAMTAAELLPYRTETLE